MKAKAVVAVIALVIAIFMVAGTARADDSGPPAAASVTCTWELGPGSFHITCTTSENAVYECQLSFSWAAGIGLFCSGPQGSLSCSSRPTPTCTLTKDGASTTYVWRR